MPGVKKLANLVLVIIHPTSACHSLNAKVVSRPASFLLSQKAPNFHAVKEYTISAFNVSKIILRNYGIQISITFH